MAIKQITARVALIDSQKAAVDKAITDIASLALLSWGSSDHMQDKINSQQHLEKWDESRKPSLRWITYLIKP